jgi:hypothetical protein
MSNLDSVEAQILSSLAKEEKKKVTEIMNSGIAAGQTVFNRVEKLVLEGYLIEERKNVPPTRFLSLSEKGKEALKFAAEFGALSEAIEFKPGLVVSKEITLETVRQLLRELSTINFLIKILNLDIYYVHFSSHLNLKKFETMLGKKITPSSKDWFLSFENLAQTKADHKYLAQLYEKHAEEFIIADMIQSFILKTAPKLGFSGNKFKLQDSLLDLKLAESLCGKFDSAEVESWLSLLIKELNKKTDELVTWKVPGLTQYASYLKEKASEMFDSNKKARDV